MQYTKELYTATTIPVHPFKESLNNKLEHLPHIGWPSNQKLYHGHSSLHVVGQDGLKCLFDGFSF